MGPGHDLPRSLEFMYAVRARLSASSIRATMRAVPFFSFRYNYVEARRRDFPNASIESIEQNSWIAIDLASPRNRRSTRLSDRNERNERKIRKRISLFLYIYIYIDRWSVFFNSDGSSLDLSSIFLGELRFLIDVAPIISICPTRVGSHRRTCAYASL